MNIYVGNLPYTMTETQLREAFEEYGTVSSVAIIKDRYTGKSRGFAFVEMPADDEANNAMSQLNGQDFDGRQLKINEAREKRPSRDGGGYGNRGGYRG